ncbi:RNA dependent RNA polymerase [Diplodia seriata splipalmivirus 1]|uniref:RNA dependent RNA polymerase n=1 Tax=Diplodia seriata splipalmivirus 1 TaxID=2932870 RepID=A0A8T9JI21_9VIRU|nr:RNA dependent RNA polymerase [Diplodia seriata splipalmivirus 1]
MSNTMLTTRVSEKFFIPKVGDQGVVTPGNNFFDPDFGLDDNVDDFKIIPQQEVDREANSWLEEFGYEPLNDEDRKVLPQIVAAEVGDDEEAVSNSKQLIAYELTFMRLLDMKISREDTAINPQYGNFAEDLILLPSGYYQTYLAGRNRGIDSSMSYLDVPKLRLAIDIRPMRIGHSGTNDGKASMVGSRLAWVHRTSVIKGTMELFSLFQDVNLGIHRDRRFAYLPQTLGGYGKPIPFSEPSNLERFIHAFKQGTHTELIREIVRRTSDSLRSLSDGNPYREDLLLTHVSRFQSSYHDWVKGKSIYCPISWADIPPELAEFEVRAEPEDSVKSEVIQRLTAEGFLVSQTKLEIAVEHNNLSNSLLEEVDFKTALEIRARKSKEWMKLSIFGMESYGLIKEINLHQRGWKPLAAYEVLEFQRLVSDKRYNLKQILRREPSYWKEALDRVYETGPMKVPFTAVPLDHTSGHFVLADQGLNYRTFVEDTEIINEYQDMMSWLKNGCVGPPPSRLINDDNSLIKQVEEGPPLSIIITDDAKLCREANFKTGKPVLRVPTIVYYYNLYFMGLEPWNDHVSEKFPHLRNQVLEDQGSLQSAEELKFFDGQLFKTVKQPLNWHKGLGVRDPIIRVDLGDGPSVDWTSLLYDRKNITGFKARKHPKFGSRPRGTGRTSWRT